MSFSEQLMHLSDTFQQMCLVHSYLGSNFEPNMLSCNFVNTYNKRSQEEMPFVQVILGNARNVQYEMRHFAFFKFLMGGQNEMDIMVSKILDTEAVRCYLPQGSRGFAYFATAIEINENAPRKG